MPDALHHDELFIADKQEYDYKKVTVVKTQKVKKGFNMDELNVGDEKKPKEDVISRPGAFNPADAKKQAAAQENAPKADGAPANPPKNPAPRERSVEELSMSDDDAPTTKKVPTKKAYVPPAKTEEKTTDVFKNLYSEFKDYMPSNEKKDQSANQTTAQKNKPGFMDKARGFFGL